MKQFYVRRGEAALSSSRAAVLDIVHRHAILIPESRSTWLCRQQNGRRKPGYRTEETASRVAELLRLVDGQVSTPYRCRMEAGLRQVGEHFHLATPRVDTHRSHG